MSRLTRTAPRRILACLALAALAAAGLTLTGATAALAQNFSLDFGSPDGSTTARIIQLLAVFTVLSIAPGILVMVTSFTRIIVVLSFLRFAMGTQSTPPNIVMISLAMFLTFFIMQPTMDQAYREGVLPLIEQQIDEAQALERVVEPFHAFMLKHVRDQDLQLFLEISKAGPEEVGAQTPLRALTPAFMISELRRAFEIGFLIYIPFVIIDMVIASILMSMGMMMIPPVIVSMPFKLIFFVLLDGWYMIAGSLVQSYGPL
ncbi:flagellar type III secretion system pore protein FliP [Oceanibaculum pacificum]|uniref:Flagellar biosynthetic protein FliP n=1 Tax=Oceanibaculum pacificum TaxID=580166 RepID=A0A154W372_9PROT|nr:flagellar type III secretion system pore protein FliP [Oceanibaculum pacificum]KZD07978.1 flagellar biosynthesis protein flip [Oceanibaculum pacificum]